MPPKRLMDPSGVGTGRRRMLLLKSFPQKFSAEERVERCMDAFYELHDGEGPSSTTEEMFRKLEMFVKEADQILNDLPGEKEHVAQILSSHTWFKQNNREVRYLVQRNCLSIDSVSSEQTRTTEAVSWAQPPETPNVAPWPKQGSWIQHQRQKERSRSPFRAEGHWGADSLDYNAWENADGLGIDAEWDAGSPDGGWSTKAKAPPPRAPGRHISKASIAADGQSQKFAEALVRCLPEDIQPWNDAPKGYILACHTARGDRWPKLDVVGGGAVGTSSLSDLHELSVALLNKVKEKALAGAVRMEEGTDLTTMFVKENKLGPASEAALRKLPVAANLRVIGAGSLTGCDPQAVVMARIRRARDAAYLRPADIDLDIGSFVEENWVSTEVERQLRMCPSDAQRQVIAEGPVLGQSPSAELQERLDRVRSRVPVAT